MVKTGCKTVRILCTLFCESEVLALVLHAGSLMDREVSVMHLIYDDVRWLDLRALVLSPSLRIGLSPVNHRSAPAVHSDSLSRDTGSLREPPAVSLY